MRLGPPVLLEPPMAWLSVKALRVRTRIPPELFMMAPPSPTPEPVPLPLAPMWPLPPLARLLVNVLAVMVRMTAPHMAPPRAERPSPSPSPPMAWLPMKVLWLMVAVDALLNRAPPMLLPLLPPPALPMTWLLMNRLELTVRNEEARLPTAPA